MASLGIAIVAPPAENLSSRVIQNTKSNRTSPQILGRNFQLSPPLSIIQRFRRFREAPLGNCRHTLEFEDFNKKGRMRLTHRDLSVVRTIGARAFCRPMKLSGPERGRSGDPLSFSDKNADRHYRRDTNAVGRLLFIDLRKIEAESIQNRAGSSWDRIGFGDQFGNVTSSSGKT
jgi:hypothetical protein